ncbi:MAG: endonuclease [Bacteroidales bacterium]|nr:endonuclease [Bacteroidales bacterium]MBR5781547.1 endonuclease [Bacteroidales bacterium]
MRRNLILLFLIIVFQLFITDEMHSQEKPELRVAFWNFENFFDPFVDTTRAYNEFTEEGGQHWTLSRFYKKRNNIYKAILALSEGEPIAILGMCEVENPFVTTMLFYETPLKKHNYRVVHYEGEDRRGIDVALAYSIDKLQLVSSENIKVRSPDNKSFRTRDILYAKFYDKHSDTLHCFVNHWTSRYGGEKETIYLREMTAALLKRKVDSLIIVNKSIPKIVIMGDFNDTPHDNSILNVLNAKPSERLKSGSSDTLINLFSDDKSLGFEGTLKHQYRWQIFDQIIISSSLYNDSESLHYIKKSATIFHDDFLFVEDETYGGKKLFRTYIGPKYQGGFSDHLPVFIDLEY